MSKRPNETARGPEPVLIWTATNKGGDVSELPEAELGTAFALAFDEVIDSLHRFKETRHLIRGLHRSHRLEKIEEYFEAKRTAAVILIPTLWHLYEEQIRTEARLAPAPSPDPVVRSSDLRESPPWMNLKNIVERSLDALRSPTTPTLSWLRWWWTR